jgi:hypothetical protein
MASHDVKTHGKLNMTRAIILPHTPRRRLLTILPSKAAVSLGQRRRGTLRPAGCVRVWRSSGLRGFSSLSRAPIVIQPPNVTGARIGGVWMGLNGERTRRWSADGMTASALDVIAAGIGGAMWVAENDSLEYTAQALCSSCFGPVPPVLRAHHR